MSIRKLIVKRVSALLFTLLLSACAKTPSDFAQKYHTASKNIQMIPKGEKIDFYFKPIKKISSSSCDSKTAARVLGDEQEAILVLKLEAAKLQADAVIEYSCYTMPIDLISNCWAAKKCSGSAVKIVEQNN